MSWFDLAHHDPERQSNGSKAAPRTETNSKIRNSMQNFKRLGLNLAPAFGLLILGVNNFFLRPLACFGLYGFLFLGRLFINLLC